MALAAGGPLSCDVVPAIGQGGGPPGGPNAPSLAVHNSRLLAAYCALEPRYRQLVLVVKSWAKRRGVNTDP